MTIEPVPPSRRRFVTQLGRVASLAALGSVVSARTAGATDTEARDRHTPSDWDLSWLNQLKSATDRGVFDWSTIDTPIESPPEAIALDYAARYLDGCEAAYGSSAAARAVIVIRHLATPAALNDAAWNRYAIGESSKIVDPVTQHPALRNPFWSNAAHGPDVPPTLQDVTGRGVIVLVCNMALTHVSDRIARAHGEDPAGVHRTLLASLVPNAFAVPSGIWGLVRAQNAGCGMVRA